MRLTSIRLVKATAIGQSADDPEAQMGPAARVPLAR